MTTAGGEHLIIHLLRMNDRMAQQMEVMAERLDIVEAKLSSQDALMKKMQHVCGELFEEVLDYVDTKGCGKKNVEKAPQEAESSTPHNSGVFQADYGIANPPVSTSALSARRQENYGYNNVPEVRRPPPRPSLAVTKRHEHVELHRNPPVVTAYIPPMRWCAAWKRETCKEKNPEIFQLRSFFNKVVLSEHPMLDKAQFVDLIIFEELLVETAEFLVERALNEPSNRTIYAAVTRALFEDPEIGALMRIEIEKKCEAVATEAFVDCRLSTSIDEINEDGERQIWPRNLYEQRAIWIATQKERAVAFVLFLSELLRFRCFGNSFERFFMKISLALPGRDKGSKYNRAVSMEFVKKWLADPNCVGGFEDLNLRIFI